MDGFFRRSSLLKEDKNALHRRVRVHITFVSNLHARSERLAQPVVDAAANLPQLRRRVRHLRAQRQRVLRRQRPELVEDEVRLALVPRVRRALRV
eukprot:30809-Pelagococcus_subviridis.AAC.1